MGKIYLDSDRDANMRLRHCILFYEGQPVFVRDCGMSRALVSNLVTGEDSTVETQLLASSPQAVLGNVEVGDSYVNCERKATRRYKHGLCIDNLMVRDMPFEVREEFELVSFVVGRALSRQYKNYTEAVSSVLSGASRAVPFSQDFGVANIDGVPSVCYKDKVVGTAEEDEITVFPKFFYLKERLLSHLA